MAKVDIGIPHFERSGFLGSYHSRTPIQQNGLFLVPKPSFGVPVKIAKTNRDFSHRVRYRAAINVLSKGRPDSRLLDGKILEKELQFKPSFDDYLKAMETVRIFRDKKRSFDPNSGTLTDNVVEKSSGRPSHAGGSQENGKEGKVDPRLNTEKDLNILKQPEVFESVGGVMGKKGSGTERYGGRDKGIRTPENEFSGREVWLDGNMNSRKMEEPVKGKHLTYESNKIRSKLKNSNLRKDRNMRGGEIGYDRNSFETSSKNSWDDNALRDYRSTLRTVEGPKMAVNRIEAQTSWRRNHNQLEKAERNKFGSTYGEKRSDAFLRNVEEKDVMFERAAFKNFDESNDVMDKPRVTKMEMEERIQMLAKRLNGSDIDISQWIFDKMMRSAMIKYTDHTILRLIQIMGKLGNWRRVLQIIEWLQMGERFKSHRIKFVYTTALDVLGKARRPMEALNIFNAMQQHFSSYPDLVAYHSIAVTLGQAGHMRELFDVIDAMKSPPKKKFKTGPFEKWDPRLEPDIVVYNAVLNACVHRKQWEGAFWVLQQLKERGLQPSATTHGLVMEVMLACGKYHLVHEFFSKVQRSTIPNALTYKVLVNTLWKEGKTDEAVLAVHEMERRGIVGSAGLYYDLARCLCAADRCQEALIQIEKICKVANKPLVVTYTGLIQACLESGNIKSGAYIFNQMKDICSPNLVTFNIMLRGYLDHKMFKEAKELFQKMSVDGNCIQGKADLKVQVTPDIYSFNTMLEATFSEKNWDDFEYIYRKMLHHGFHFNSKRHLRMILDASRAGKEDLLVFTWKHLDKADRTLPAPIVQELFCSKMEKGDHLAALSCISNYQVSDLQSFSYMAWLKLFRDNGSRFSEDTLTRLVLELTSVISKSSSPNHVLENLLSSCKDFCRTYKLQSLLSNY